MKSIRNFAPARLSSNRGVSLVETLVALGILFVMMGSVAKLMSATFLRAGRSHRSTQAYVLAEQALESMRALDYEDMVGQSGNKTVAGTQFAVATTVSANDPSPNMKRVTADVSWTEPAVVKGQPGLTRNATVVTIFTQVRR